MDEILNAISSESLRVGVVERLKKSTPVEDEIIGVKLFLENNNYDFNKLASFLHSAELNIDKITTQKNSKQPSYNWLKVAAILVPLIGVSFYFLMNNGNKYDNLYSNYYEKELGLPVTLSDENNKLFNESMNLFRDEDYTSSLQGFQKLLMEKPTNDTLHYFIGVCLLENGETKAAINEFSYNFEQSFFKEKSEYRLALAYLKTKEKKKLKAQLSIILQNKNHRYYQQANALLGKL